MATSLLLSSAANAGYWVFNTPPEGIRNTFGEIGLLENPTARMAQDGELAFTFGDLKDKQRFVVSFQALPWLEGSFRFARVGKGWYDRSFGMKARLWREDEYLPDISVGVRDILGTGVYSTEYVVASKSFGPVDVSAGIGWGRLADTNLLPNPFGLLSDSFKHRESLVNVVGPGTVNFGQFFHGPKTGVFGGFAWQTPIDHLQLVAEYSSDQYKLERHLPGDMYFNVRSPVNVGLAYRPYESFAVSAGWFYGTTYGLTLSVRGDPTKTYPSALRLGPTVPDPAIRTNSQQQNALREMQSRSKSAASAMSGKAPWVDVPTPEQYTKQGILQALLSETSGVRSAELVGKSLVVDARVSDNVSDQCAKYARVASASGADFASLAVTDLQDPNGGVFLCSTASEHKPLVPIATVSARTRDITNKVKNDLGGQSLGFAGLTIGANEAWLYYENYHYYAAAEAAGRAARVLMADLPPGIEIFHLVPSFLGMRLNDITVYRGALERRLMDDAVHPDASDIVRVTPATMGGPAEPADENPGQFKWPTLIASFDPRLTQRVFDPDRPIQFMIYGDLVNFVQITPSISLTAEFTGKIWSNYTFSRDPLSELHHVRSDVLKYEKYGAYGISNLSIAYRTRLSEDVFAEVKGGYLEDMYMGVGGQVLWRPSNSRLALGADLYKVWQRAYDRLFGLQQFGGQHFSMITGHVSAYYDSPWYGLRFAVHGGRYLAGDRGATFEISRRFLSGVEIGVWATFTNVPFSKFGEGSFDKGISIHIPFEWGLPIWTQSSYDLHMASLTRDGGQRLAGDDSLENMTDSSSYGQIMDHADAILEP